MVTAERRGKGDNTERGFTLIELTVLVAIVALVASVGYAALAQRPAQARLTAVAFNGLVAQARALAMVTGSSGASIGVVRENGSDVATLYAGRPITGAPAPQPAANTPALRTSTALTLLTPSGSAEPPFALFFSASGHMSAQPNFRIDVDAALPIEPACSLATGIGIVFADGVHDQAYRIGCELAQLDLERPSAPPAR